MLLFKKCQFFHYLFLLKIRLEIRFNNVPDRKETFFEYKNKTLQCPKKIVFFQKGWPMLLVKKCRIFLYLDLVKIRLEKVSNNILEEKETFFYYKNTNFWQSHKSNFSKGVNPCFWSKNVIFFIICFCSE